MANYTVLTPAIIEILQLQTKLELGNSQRYHAFAKFCDAKQYLGAKKFYEKHSLEEREHMQKVMSYLIDKRAPVMVGETQEYKCDYRDLVEVLELSLGAEKSTTDAWKAIYTLAWKEKDFTTSELALGFLKEQHEEEALFINILDRWNILKDMPCGMYFLDCEIEKNYM